MGEGAGGRSAEKDDEVGDSVQLGKDCDWEENVGCAKPKRLSAGKLEEVS